MVPQVEVSEISIKNQVLSIKNQNGETAMEIADNKTATHFGDLLIENEINEIVASLDNEGNATFSGNVAIGEDLSVSGDARLDTLTARQATFSGELVADSARIRHLRAESIEGLEAFIATLTAQKISTENISGMENQVLDSSSTSSASLEQYSSSEVEKNSTPSSSLTAQSKTWTIGDPSSDVKVEGNITILGKTSLAQTIISGPLTQDGTLLIDEGNSINVLGGTLYLQNKATGGIDLLAGKVTIDTNGNAIFEGDLTVKGKLFANVIAIPPEDEIASSSAAPRNDNGKLRIEGAIVASGEVQVGGNLTASGSAQVAQLNIQRMSNVLTLGEDGIWETSASAGTATLTAGLKEIVIRSPFVTQKSLIYLTPLGSTENQTLYIKAIDETATTFTIAIDQSITKEIKFNFWIVN